jgi:NAD(P)-dependent dehydrogenase (short-subunit alcohol dehydrogenase family)
MTAPTSQRVWFITGASRGFGARIARAALQRGDAVVATARKPETVTQALGEHPGLLPVALDVTDEPQAQRAVAAALERFGRIDILVNNAGYGLLGAVEEASADEVRRLYETNVFGLLNVTRAALPAMRQRRSGRIVNFSSIGGVRAAAGFGVYSSTKFAVEGLSDALHAELAPLGIHVSSVQPGYFRTDFLDSSSLAVSPAPIDDYAATAGKVRVAARNLNHNQPGDPERLAGAILALVDAPNPPVRLPLGTDTLAAIEQRLTAVAQETEQWREIASSTDL